LYDAKHSLCSLEFDHQQVRSRRVAADDSAFGDLDPKRK
jgi:hypothetical protein